MSYQRGYVSSRTRFMKLRLTFSRSLLEAFLLLLTAVENVWFMGLVVRTYCRATVTVLRVSEVYGDKDRAASPFAWWVPTASTYVGKFCPQSQVIRESSARGARAKILVYIYIYIYITE